MASSSSSEPELRTEQEILARFQDMRQKISAGLNQLSALDAGVCSEGVDTNHAMRPTVTDSITVCVTAAAVRLSFAESLGNMLAAGAAAGTVVSAARTHPQHTPANCLSIIP